MNALGVARKVISPRDTGVPKAFLVLPVASGCDLQAVKGESYLDTWPLKRVPGLPLAQPSIAQGYIRTWILSLFYPRAPFLGSVFRVSLC